MRTRLTLAVASVIGAIACTGAAGAADVVTQTQDRSYATLWLLSDWIQQSLSHEAVQAEHNVTAVPVFDDKAVSSADIVYLSPSLDELVLTEAEMDVLETFVQNGGRLIIPADSGDWSAAFDAIAARFDVFYGDTFINGIIEATTDDFDNPITNGSAGVVTMFTGASTNNSLTSTNDDFQVLATYTTGVTAIGYLPLGDGEVIFLADFNTWDNDMLFDHDNQVLWANLFGSTTLLVQGDIDGDGAVHAVDLSLLLGNWGACDGGGGDQGGCIGDLNFDLGVNAADLAILLANWTGLPD